MDGGGDGEVPGGVGGHAEAEEGPDAVVVEGGDEHRGGAARPEYVRPCPLVQPVVDVVYVTAMHYNFSDISMNKDYKKKKEYVCLSQELGESTLHRRSAG